MSSAASMDITPNDETPVQRKRRLTKRRTRRSRKRAKARAEAVDEFAQYGVMLNELANFNLSSGSSSPSGSSIEFIEQHMDPVGSNASVTISLGVASENSQNDEVEEADELDKQSDDTVVIPSVHENELEDVDADTNIYLKCIKEWFREEFMNLPSRRVVSSLLRKLNEEADPTIPG